MAIITVDYFKAGLKNIPNLNDQSVIDAVTYAIDTHEPRYLNKLLGYELTKALLADMGEDSLSPRFDKLLNGAEYQKGDRLNMWSGLIEETASDSPIAYYVMVNYLRENASHFTGIGEQVPTSKNANVVSVSNRVMMCYNKMSELNRSLIEFLKSSNEYPEFKGVENNDLLRSFSPFGIIV
jgi:hypothetical protein